MKLNSLALVALIALGLISCETKKLIQTPVDRAALLTEVMTGTYSSAQQSIEDPDYYSISLHMFPIWENKPGNYLYVEQAMMSKQQEPYRQRIYKITEQKNGTLVSTLYTLDQPERFINKYAEPEFFDQFDESILSLRDGCDVLMTQKGGKYLGGTEGKSCSSEMQGASYATAEVSIESGKIVSWDRGFDADDKQVWGAEKGGYIFKLVRKVAMHPGMKNGRVLKGPQRERKRSDREEGNQE